LTAQVLVGAALLGAACGSDDERTAATCAPGNGCGDASVAEGGGRGGRTDGSAGSTNSGGSGASGGASDSGTDARGTGGGGDAATSDAEPGSDCGASGPELCNGLDDDCDGSIDEDFDFTSPSRCGTCTNDCRADAGEQLVLRCIPSSAPGRVPGVCQYKCAGDFYDLDGNRGNGCEYFCQWNPDGTVTMDLGGPQGCGIDNDCDGQVDEDVNTCTDVANCGQCGAACRLAHATALCIKTGDAGVPCTLANTYCEIGACAPGYRDADGDAANGCETELPDGAP
jgi:hypothetical protein